ncbi:hypothetical protein NF27_CG00830 [Candidatus Jidaibacter acanthamoeba]|uniref:Uncharacterized protein n=1 Tax=Candidatus Jidaibacter acanthamoebae TaxID=86105 RepID=A0A0C1QPF6_9RICK|nr:hypothetical protein [Candidatus Jidaibacter acanthamoeba]KIE05903.1 hypothetical protein NF27_CG00830 [Candidatus Jidaibacter acanthamoeba]
MAILFNQDNVFENVPIEEMAKYFISRIDLKPFYDSQKLLVNELGEIKVEYYKGSVFFFEHKHLNDESINKLEEVTKVLQNAYNYSNKFFENRFNLGKLYFSITDGEIEIHLESPNKDCSIDFNRQALLRSIKMSQQENSIREATAKLLSIIPTNHLSSAANVNSNTTPNVDFNISDIHLANDNKLLTEPLSNREALASRDYKKSHMEIYKDSKANQSTQHSTNSR